jgi:membrane fusion protein (multidrug efflux system)
VYVNFSVPQQEIATMTDGRPIEAVSDALGKPEAGKISSIESLVDEATRNVHVQATFNNASGKMHPGMYVDVKLAHGGTSSVVMVPSSSIVYAPFGDSVYVVGDMKDPKGKTYRGVQQHFVKLGGSRGDQVAITSGLNPGDEVVTSGAFKLRPGAAVIVNNSVQPANSPAPKPENS